MQLRLKARLQNKPGQLVSLLNPISSAGGNITGVRQEPVPQGEQGTVEVEFDAPAPKLEAITKEIKSLGIGIIDFAESAPIASADAILIGENAAASIHGLLAKGAAISEFELLGRSARLRVGGSPDAVEKSLESLRSHAKKEGLLLVEALE